MRRLIPQVPRPVPQDKMIAGQFDIFGEPCVDGRIVIPRLGVDETIRFLLDTGARTTCIHSSDARRVGIPISQLANPTHSIGVAGVTSYYREPVILTFGDGQGRVTYNVQVNISEPSPVSLALPSLLGRDITNNWHIVYAPLEGRLEITPLRSDGAVEPPVGDQ